MDGGRKEAAATEVWLHFAIIMFHEKQFEEYRIFLVIRRGIFQRNFAWSTSVCSKIGVSLIATGFSIESGTQRLITAYFGIYSRLLCV